MNNQFKITKSTKSRIKTVDPNNIKFGTLFTDHMLNADYLDGIWQKPEILPFGNISFNPGLASLHYGQTIFEGMKAFRNKAGDVFLFRPKENLTRFNISAKRMAMPEISEDIFMTGLEKLVSLDKDWLLPGKDNSLYIRPFMFATEECIKSKISSTFKFMIIMSPAGPYFSEPIKGKIETEYIRSADGGVGFTKCGGNYGSSLYPAKLAQDAGYSQLLWTDAKEHRYFEESGTMNLMFVKNGKIVTPKTSSTILKGITRDSLIALAKSMNLEVEERNVSVKEIINGLKDRSVTEAFGVGTAVVVAPFSTIGQDGTDYTLPLVTEESISSKLKNALRDIRTGETEDEFGWMWKIA